MMDYSLLLGVHYPARHFTRASLEAGPSFSLDGTLPHVSPQPGGTLPGDAGPWRHSGGQGLRVCVCVFCVFCVWGGVLWVDGISAHNHRICCQVCNPVQDRLC